MTGTDIKRKIDYNNKIIESILSPNVFTLNNTVSHFLEENKYLQQQCRHEFKDGYCIYCYKEDENADNQA